MRIWIGAAALALLGTGAAMAAEGERIRVKGEAIDTWCYFSGVMGGPDAVIGTAHHTCALWCSAGGIPVGLLAEDGTVYMVLKIGEDDGSASGDSQLKVAAHVIEADGMHYVRDGINYILVEEVVADLGIQTENHTDYGFIPPFTVPKEDRQ